MVDYTVDELAIARSLDAPGGDDFREMVRVRNAAETARVGTDELAASAEYLLPTWNNPFEPKRLFLARRHGRVIGRAIYETRADAASTTCWIEVNVDPDLDDPGVERDLHERMLQLARDDGRRTANYYVIHRETGSTDRLVPPTGAGSVPADEESSVLLTEYGWTLGQVERISRLALPVDRDVMARHLATATDAAGPDYRLVQWSGTTPDEWLDGIAELNTRMSTDAPIGAMAEDEDPWTADRVRAENVLLEEMPRTLVVVGVVHSPSGALVAFNELSVPDAEREPVMQEDTLVLAEHRGHRLGMVVKAANLLRLVDVAPRHPSVITFNAEENRHMLSVNEAVGFAPIGYEAGWTITL